MKFSRREFAAFAAAAAAAGYSRPASAEAVCAAEEIVDDQTIRLNGDGLGLSSTAYADLLATLCRERQIDQDNYLLGGEVERFERRSAEILGKEMAVFLPSGTLANQLALRLLAGDKRRVIVPEQSHVYNDTGDASQTLSQLNLLPLAHGAATYRLDDVQAAIRQTAAGRVATGVGALLIESPVRRRFGEMFDWEEMQRITAFARRQGIGSHLDGARLFIASAYTGISPAEYAAPFDTVYVSSWKYFNCGIGAILAGPRSLLAELYHTRRMFGGNLNRGWPAALVGGHFMEGFVERLEPAIRVSESFYTAIAEHPQVEVTRVAAGTNVTRLAVRDVPVPRFLERLAGQGVVLRGSADGVFYLGVNETWNRTTAAALTAAFETALA